MGSFRKTIAALVTLGIGAGSMLPASAMNAYGAQNAGRVNVAPVPRSIFTSHDFGRRPAASLVRTTILLRYNHQAELDKLASLLGDRRSPLYHHFLSNAQFNAYFAPTAQQQATVIDALRAAGLRVTHAYPNRTLLDAQGTSANVERYFGTEMHTISQGRYGVRYANVKPATIGANLAPFVKAVSLSNLIVARTGPRASLHLAQGLARSLAPQASRLGTIGDRNDVLPGRFIVPAYAEPATSPGVANAVADSGFESGAFGHGWGRCSSSRADPLATFTSVRKSSGRYSGHAGSTSSKSGEQYGHSGFCQLVRVPARGVLTAYLYQLSNERNTRFAAEDVFLLTAKGEIAAVLAESVTDRAAWIEHRWNLAPYAGRKLYLYFGVHGNGNRRTFATQFVDDVSLTGAKPTPPPQPTPEPTATPVPKPTATPVPKPTVTPVPKPTATPTPLPKATATPAPNPTMTPPSTSCAGAPDNGPLTTSGNTGYYFATGVADGFDFPVQHGCNGAGQTVAIEISAPVRQSDVDAYLQAAGIAQRGTLTNVPVDGGGIYDGNDDGSYAFDASIEAALDSQSIVGLAPAANVLVYNFPDLSDQSIEDGYNQTISDDAASVTNSSFGGCESEDPSFAQTTNAIAEQAAVIGITFVASSGDSGSDGCESGNAPPVPEAPASGPYFVSVGGDNFTESATGVLTSLTATGDLAGTGFLSGGGTSTLFPLPSYQAGVSNVAPGGRNVPDLSLPGVNVLIALGDSYYGADGTSWSSPLFVALIAETNELQHATGAGFVNPRIYALHSIPAGTGFTDVTIGSNGAYSALPGYDEVTGLGAPKGEAFARNL